MCEDGSKFVIHVLGRDAPKVQEVLKEANRLHTEGKIDEVEQGLMTLVAAVTGWSDDMAIDGKVLPYSEVNARRLMTDERTEWVAEQVIPFSLARRNFANSI